MLKYVTLKEKELEEVFSQSTEISSKDAEGTLGTLLLYLSDFLSFMRDSSVLKKEGYRQLRSTGICRSLRTEYCRVNGAKPKGRTRARNLREGALHSEILSRLWVCPKVVIHLTWVSLELRS